MKNANQIQFSINQHEYRCNIIYISRQPWIRRLLTSQCKGAKSEKLMSRKKQNQRCLWQKINKIKMNKKIKAAMLVAAVATVGLGGYKTYNAYQVNNMSDADLLVVENLSALSDPGTSSSSRLVKVADDPEGYCWKPVVKTKQHSHSYQKDGKTYYEDCKITTTSYVQTDRPRPYYYITIGQKVEDFFKGIIYIEWDEKKHTCKSPKIKTATESQPKSSEKHSCKK